jgi:hypothetical protein
LNGLRSDAALAILRKSVRSVQFASLLGEHGADAGNVLLPPSSYFVYTLRAGMSRPFTQSLI